MSTIISSQTISYQPIISPKSSIFSDPIQTSSNPRHDLLAKIHHQVQAGLKLEARQQALQNTVYDLRKLIQVSNRQSLETMQYLHGEIQKMEEKKEQYKAVRKFVQGKDSHLQKCMLFWNLLA